MDGRKALHGISLEVEAQPDQRLLRTRRRRQVVTFAYLNRLIDLADVSSCDGEMLLDGRNILDKDTDVIELRRKIGVVFSRPIPLPLTIYHNVSFGLEVAGEKDDKVLHEQVKKALRKPAMGRGRRPTGIPSQPVQRRAAAAAVPGTRAGAGTGDHPAG